jgi:hypothetical protein
MMTEFVLFPVAKRFAQRSPVAVLIPEDISATKQSFDLHEPTVKIGPHPRSPQQIMQPESAGIFFLLGVQEQGTG